MFVAVADQARGNTRKRESHDARNAEGPAEAEGIDNSTGRPGEERAADTGAGAAEAVS